jgi:hypothetical protein
MFYMRNSGLAPQRRYVAPHFVPGLLDALSEPQLLAIADAYQAADPATVRSHTRSLPLRVRAGQVGLLDALAGTVTDPTRSGHGRKGADQIIRNPRGRLSRGARPEHGISLEDELSDLGTRTVDAFAQAGKDLWTGYRIGASGFYDTLGNAVGLINRANDFMTDFTGVGHMSEGTMWKDAENWLHHAAARVAPKPEELPRSVPSKIYAGIGQAPAEVAQYLTATRWLGPIMGMASVDAIRESDQGLEAAAGAAAKAGLLGLGAKALEPLSWGARAAAMGSLGAASTFGHGGEPEDLIAYALLGASGVPRAKQPNLAPLRMSYNEFADAARHADASLEIIRALAPYRRRQERVQINRNPGILLENVARRSDELLGYETTPGKKYKLPPSPLMRSSRIYDYGRKKWWKRREDVEVKREQADQPADQWFADEYLMSEGARIAQRRENEILRRARLQLGDEGRFDSGAERLGRAVRRRMRKRGRDN